MPSPLLILPLLAVLMHCDTVATATCDVFNQLNPMITNDGTTSLSCLSSELNLCRSGKTSPEENNVVLITSKTEGVYRCCCNSTCTGICSSTGTYFGKLIRVCVVNISHNIFNIYIYAFYFFIIYIIIIIIII